MGRITIVGLGAGSPAQLTVGAMEAMRDGRPVLLRTARHPVVSALAEAGITFESCDDLYEHGETFEAVYAAIVDRVLQRSEGAGLVFAVPGHPMVGEETVRILLERVQASGVAVDVVTGPSFLDSLFTVLRLDPVGGLELLDAYRLPDQMPSGTRPAVIMQVHSRTVASAVKLALMERYPDDHMVTLVRAAGVPAEERLASMPLYEIDRQDWVDYLTSLYVPPMVASQPGDVDPRRWAPRRWSVDPLVEVMAALRGPTGCPWDKEQTHQSLKRYMLEEAYEAVEAVETGDPGLLKEELGDVLLQVVFHAQLASERGDYDMHDIVQTITEKLVRRHPHVFGDVVAATPADVTRNWEAIKRQEKGNVEPQSLLDGMSRAMPALMRAAEMQKRAAKVGFEWDSPAGAAEKVTEELQEVMAAKPDEVEAEVGDLLFACVNVARMLQVDPETALERTNMKFITRFQYIEREAAKIGRKLADMTLEEMDSLWNQAKKVEFGQNTAKK